MNSRLIRKIYMGTLVILPFLANAQSNLLNRLENKARNRADQRVDEAMDKGLDKTEEAIKNGGSSKDQSKGQKEQSAEKSATYLKKDTSITSFESYSHYDFVPGDKIVYAEDFAQDVIGEFPLKWHTSNHGETVTIKGLDGKWMRMFPNGKFASPAIKSLPENFTMEFDLVIHLLKEGGYIYPELTFGLAKERTEDTRLQELLKNDSYASFLGITLLPNFEGQSGILVKSEQEGNEVFSNNQTSVKNVSDYFDKAAHISLWVQKQRLRLWVNGVKVYDIPQAVPENPGFSRFFFGISGSNYEENELGFYLSNIKIAVGAPDLRNKLLTEGRFVTSGILFDVNSDRIKPESYGILQQMAAVLKDNPSVKVKIVGHTDSDGEEAKNLDLSKRRAAAVKQALTANFSIESSRLETDGKGESQPVTDNNTKEGKAQNRRVEFIKL